MYYFLSVYICFLGSKFIGRHILIILSVCLSVRQWVCLSVRPSVRLSVCPSVSESVCPSVRQWVSPSVRQWDCLLIHWSQTIMYIFRSKVIEKNINRIQIFNFYLTRPFLLWRLWTNHYVGSDEGYIVWRWLFSLFFVQFCLNFHKRLSL